MRISMWGPKSAGKTTYIAMIYGTALKSTTNWIVKPSDVESTNFVRLQINNLRKGEFPLPTSFVNEPLYYKYQIRSMKANSSKKIQEDEKEFLDSLFEFIRGAENENLTNGQKDEEVTVTFADVAGEQFIQEDISHPLWDHLADSDALICLLDPSDANDHFEITYQLLQYLWLKLKDRPNALVNGMLPHYVAFCFSKMDQPEFIEFINRPKELVSYLENKSNLDIDKLLLQYVFPERLKYFTVSSVGLDANIDSSGRIVNPKEVHPINILEPLRWMFLVSGK